MQVETFVRRSSVSFFASALLAAAGTLATGAHAAPNVHIDVTVNAPPARAPHPRVHLGALPPPSVVQVPVPVPVAHERHPGYAGGYPEAPAGCSAPRWHPRVRYMPGQVVWRKGELFVARGISARVWNENSPPEWTPRYWTPAVCQQG